LQKAVNRINVFGK